MKRSGEDGTIPDGWQVVSLGDVAEVVGGTTPSRARGEYWGGEIPWVVPSELTELSGRYLTSTRESITPIGMQVAGLRIIPAGSVLLTSRATIGAAAINGSPVTTNQGFQNLVPQSGTEGLWLYYWIASMRHELQKRGSGSTFKEVSRDSVRTLPLLLPPIAEQRRIAAVLDAIDDAIERTDDVISATERLRDALLHDLLSHGVPGWHSEWRDVPGLGTIPGDWNVVQLGEVCAPPEYGASATARPFDPGLPRYVRITDLTDDGRLRAEDARSANPSQVEGYQLEPGDLLFARSGATVGKTYLYRPTDGPCVWAGYLIRFRPFRNVAAPGFLERFTRSGFYRRWIESMFRAGAQPNINAAEYASLPLPLPPLPEQHAVAAMLDGVDAAIESAREERRSLNALKGSTGEALLTGRVRTSGPCR